MSEWTKARTERNWGEWDQIGDQNVVDFKTRRPLSGKLDVVFPDGHQLHGLPLVVKPGTMWLGDRDGSGPKHHAFVEVSFHGIVIPIRITEFDSVRFHPD